MDYSKDKKDAGAKDIKKDGDMRGNNSKMTDAERAAQEHGADTVKAAATDGDTATR